MFHLPRVMFRLTAIVLTLCTIRVGPLRAQWTTDVSTAEDQPQEICGEAATVTSFLKQCR